MFTVTEMIDSYAERKLSVGPDLWEEIEEDDMEMSRLVVESLVSEELNERMRVRYNTIRTILISRVGSCL
jgi:hypothetical protein